MNHLPLILMLSLIFGVSFGCKTRELTIGGKPINEFSMEPGLINFTKPNIQVDPTWPSTNLCFEVWVSNDSNGEIEDVGYVARGDDSPEYEKSDWRYQVVKTAMDAVKKWEFTPLIIDGETTVVAIDFICNVSITNGTCRWLIKDVDGDLIFDSENPNAAKYPVSL